MVEGPVWESWDAPLPEQSSRQHDTPTGDGDDRRSVSDVLGPLLSRYPLAGLGSVLIGMHLYTALVGGHPLQRNTPSPLAMLWFLVGTLVAIVIGVVIVWRQERTIAVGWLMVIAAVWTVIAVGVFAPSIARSVTWAVSALGWLGIVWVTFIWLREHNYGLERAAQATLWLFWAGAIGLFGVGAFLLAGPGTLVGQIIAVVPWALSGGATHWSYVLPLGIKLLVAPFAGTIGMFVWFSKGSIL